MQLPPPPLSTPPSQRLPLTLPPPPPLSTPPPLPLPLC